MTLGETKRANNSSHEHIQICEAIKNHDALLAEKCAREHINNSKKNMEHLGWENLIKLRRFKNEQDYDDNTPCRV